MSNELKNRKVLIDVLEGLLRKLKFGCGNHGCLVSPPKGQGTNMGCTCKPRDFSRHLLNISMELAETPYNWEEIKNE